MAVKTYVLLSIMDATAPIYQQVEGGQRIQITKPPFHRPTMRETFQDKDGVVKIIRYKSNATDRDGKPIIYQREQMDVLKMEANEPFTTQERKSLQFRNGILATQNTIAQLYLESHPEFEGFEGFCETIPNPRYKLLDNVAEAKIKNSDTRLRIKAANKVAELDLDAAQAMLIRLNGSFFDTPNNLEDCQNALWEFIDDAEEGGLNAVLKADNENTVDEKTSILIGKLISAGTLSFDQVEGKISKKDKQGKWIEVREMSNQYSLEERLRLFSDFLNTEDGKPLKNDLEKDLTSFEKKQKLVTA